MSSDQIPRYNYQPWSFPLDPRNAVYRVECEMCDEISIIESIKRPTRCNNCGYNHPFVSYVEEEE